MKIGILALQGCVDPHIAHLEKLGAQARLIRYANDCEDIDGYILPGGESTTMLKLIKINGLHQTLKKEWASKPVWGICAGAILIGTKVTSPEQFCYKLIDYQIARNAYGAQIMSHYGVVAGYNVAFIRAPKIIECGPDVEIITEHNHSPTWVRDKKNMATTFHPELNTILPSPMHKYFIENFF